MLAALQVRYRDISHMVSIALMVGLMTPAGLARPGGAEGLKCRRREQIQIKGHHYTSCEMLRR
jgi:hypothetical protein